MARVREIRGGPTVVSRFRWGGTSGEPVFMDEVVRQVIEGLVVISLAAVASNVLVFAFAVVVTARAARRRDRLTRELDDVLAELLGDEAVGRPGATPGRVRR